MSIPNGHPAAAAAGGRLESFVDEIVLFRGVLHLSGWAFHTAQAVCEIGWRSPEGAYQAAPAGSWGLESLDVSAQNGERARRSRFRLQIAGIGAAGAVASSRLVFTLDDGTRLESAPLQDVANGRLANDPYHRLQARFFELLREQPAGPALEVGARARSGTVRRQLFPPGTGYIGMDILAGENVDVVGDAHALGDLFGPETFAAVLSISVFEHLLMPWKVVLEMNKVMRTGGLALIATHHTFPLHETPWDFFRFSDQAWHGLLNQATGFEILETALGEPASIVPHLHHQVLAGLDGCPAFIGSAVLARKISSTSLSWPVDLKTVIDSMYPPEISGAAT